MNESNSGIFPWLVGIEKGVMDIHGYLNGLFDQINGINGIWRFNTYWWDGSVTNGKFITNMDNGTWIRYLIGYK